MIMLNDSAGLSFFFREPVRDMRVLKEEEKCSGQELYKERISYRPRSRANPKKYPKKDERQGNMLRTYVSSQHLHSS